MHQSRLFRSVQFFELLASHWCKYPEHTRFKECTYVITFAISFRPGALDGPTLRSVFYQIGRGRTTGGDLEKELNVAECHCARPSNG